MTRFALPLLLALGLSAGPLARSIELPCAWRTADVTVDGQDDEWPGGATLLPASPVAVGVANDDEFLYLRLRTSDRGMQTHLLFGGLTVWIDPGGREKKGLGIKYPVGARLPGPGSRRERGERPEGLSPDDRPRPTPPGRSDGAAPPLDPFVIVPPRAELLGPGKDEARSLVLDHLPPGVAVAIARVEDALVYEMKIPLARSADHRFGLGIAPGTRIAIGLETGRLQRPERPGRPGGIAGGGRPGGRGGGSSGGMRGGPPRGGRGGADRDDQTTARPLSVWIQARLATTR